MGSANSFVLALIAMIAVHLVSSEIRPNPIPKISPSENVVDKTLYDLALGPNNRVQQRIVNFENYISGLVNYAEGLINKALDKTEADVTKVANSNGIAKVDATITYVNRQVTNFEANIYSLVDAIIKKVRTAVKELKTQIENETQASIAAEIVRSAISRIERLIEETITALRQLLSRTKEQLNGILKAAEAKVHSSKSAKSTRLLKEVKDAIDNSILNAENQLNQRIWSAYQLVQNEAKPLNAILHSAL